MTFVNLGIPPANDIYPPWPIAFVEVVDNAIAIAWQRILIKHPKTIATHNEDLITDELVTELAMMRRQEQPAGFNPSIFGVPVRDGKLGNRSGKSIDQMPDMTIHSAMPRLDIAADDRHDALFYECKVLKGRRNLTLYRKDGIQRFLDGQYAWHMPHAGMIGYVFAPVPPKPLDALTRYFSRKLKASTIGAVLGSVSVPKVTMNAAHASASDVTMTVHTRAFGSPGVTNIQLRHLWLY